MYQFQSSDRNVDLGAKVQFRSYFFSTSDETIAAFVRRNCKANPNLFWEITPEVLKSSIKITQPAKEVPEVVAAPKKRGRPFGVKVFQGVRTSEVMEREQE